MPTATQGTPPPDVIALTGTPGTGKTTISEHLEPPITVTSANRLAEETSATSGTDEERDARIVDEVKLHDHARDHLPSPPVLIEGHLAHHCSPDAVILLRCHPDELKRRLSARGWPPAKIDENVMAETLDALVPEIETHPAWEVDTTNTKPTIVRDGIKSLFDGTLHEILEPLGTADWTGTLTGGAPS